MQNLKIYLKLFNAISLVGLFLISKASILACGPWNPIIPTPGFFYTSKYSEVVEKTDLEKQENLKLWQKLTSSAIPLSDIEQAVYKDSWDTFYDFTEYPKKQTTNLFYTYLRNTNDSELSRFLLDAKNLEEHRANQNSPWHYPASRDKLVYNEWLYDFIEGCKRYDGTRMKDRYGLQIIRAYFTARDYENCIKFYEDYFSQFLDDNLFKRMSMNYIAGCWKRLGNDDKAFEMFAKSGDFNVIASPKGVEYMIEINPDNSQLMDYIESCANDSAIFCGFEPIAKKVLKGRKTRYPADWEFLLAYIYGEHKGDYKEASKHIQKAFNSKFSNKAIKDYARAYRAKIDAANYNPSNLLSDLKWLESKINLLNPETTEWNRRLQNIVYVHWIPNLWKAGDYSTAIFLCGYAENLLPSQQKYECYDYEVDEWWTTKANMSLDEMRKSDKYWNTEDYSNFTFQLMGSLNSSQLINVKSNLSSEYPLWKMLTRYIRKDNPYWDELIGTLALREENYGRALNYLAKVPVSYQRTMNLYKEKSLNRDPFYAYSNRWEIYKSDYSDYSWEYEQPTQKVRLSTMDNAKYNFAKQMLEYKNQIKHGKTSDDRGLARIKYAIGRRNSFEECWALTQYWRGWVPRFTPDLQYWERIEGSDEKYDFLFDYEDSIGHKTIWDLFEKELQRGLEMLKTDEAKAEAQYLLGNIKTVVKHYPQTNMANYIRHSCDNWSTGL